MIKEDFEKFETKEEIEEYVKNQPEWKEYPALVISGQYTIDQAIGLCANQVIMRLRMKALETERKLADFRVLCPCAFEELEGKHD